MKKNIKILIISLLLILVLLSTLIGALLTIGKNNASRDKILIGYSNRFTIFDKDGKVFYKSEEDDSKYLWNYKVSNDANFIGYMELTEIPYFEDNYPQDPFLGTLKIYDVQENKLESFGDLGLIHNFDFGKGDEIFIVDQESNLKKFSRKNISGLANYGPKVNLDSSSDYTIAYTKDGIYTLTTEMDGSSINTYSTFIREDDITKILRSSNSSGTGDYISQKYEVGNDKKHLIVSEYTRFGIANAFSPAAAARIISTDCDKFCANYGLGYYTMYSNLPKDVIYNIQDLSWIGENICFSENTSNIIYCAKYNLAEKKGDPFEAKLSDLSSPIFDIYEDNLIYIKEGDLVLEKFNNILDSRKEIMKIGLKDGSRNPVILKFIN